MNIKKQYVELYNLLETNKSKKVSTILPELLELMKAKNPQKTFEVDEDGNVTRVFCYFHKIWEDVTEVEYGVKKSSASGLNSMCKAGVSAWTKQQRAIKQLDKELLTMVMAGLLAADQVEDEKAKQIEAIKNFTE